MIKKSIFILIIVLIIISLSFFGCRNQDVNELEERIAEIEEQIEEEENVDTREELTEEVETVTADKEEEAEEPEPKKLESEAINLTNNRAQDKDPFWSSDGKKIVFDSDRDGDMEIYVMNADGSNQVNITNSSETQDLSPSWSPDGQKIAYRSQKDKIAQIFTMNTDGSEKMNLTNDSNVRDVSPDWSPDGSMIAFESERDGREEIYTMNSDGSSLTMVTNNSGKDFSPSWSPDGEKIVFVSDIDGSQDIFVINIDGSNQLNLINDPEEESGDPCWSPDGEKIAFTSDRDGNIEIYIMNSDGSDIKRLTNNQGQDTNPCWSPDGEKIVFTSDRFGNQDIFVIDIKNLFDSSTSMETKEEEEKTENNIELIEVPKVEEEGGYIEKDSYVSNGGYLYVGDTERNNMCKGFISFDITDFKNTIIEEAVLSFKNRAILNDPSDLGNLIIAAHWYGDNPLVMIDYESTGSILQKFNNPDFTCNNNALKSELQKAIEELNEDRTRFQILVYFEDIDANGNSMEDGWEYNQEDIKLKIGIID